jgi:ACS family hexuronate transporter-like MFS transporter
MPSQQGKWTLCVLLFLATTLNYLDRQTLGILAPAIRVELGLNNHSLGLLFAAFYYSYTVAQFAIGGLLDRWHLRWAYAIGVLAWSLVATMMASATGFASLLILRLLLGVTESVNWPGAMRIVARSFPPQERSLGNGVFSSGTSIGALIAPSLILGISLSLGWRWAFVAVGSLGVVWFGLWVWFTRDPDYNRVWQGDRFSGSAGDAYREVVATPQFWRVLTVTVLVNPCLYFLLNWLPTYLTQHQGVDPERLSSVLTLIYLGLDAGYLACGAGVLVLTRNGWPLGAARQVVFRIASLLLALCSIVPFAPDLASVVLLLVLANFGAGCWIAMYLTMAQEVSAEHVSTAAGLLGGTGSLAGAFAMWGVGAITHASASFVAPFEIVGVAALAASLAGTAVVRNARTPVQV